MRKSKTATTAEPTNAPEQTPPLDYESAVAELEALAQAMETGRLPLAEMISGYRRGAFLLQYCNEQLNAVEQQIQLLEGQQLKPLTGLVD